MVYTKKQIFAPGHLTGNPAQAPKQTASPPIRRYRPTGARRAVTPQGQVVGRYGRQEGEAPEKGRSR
jgi:hypothetical protein